MNKPLETPSKIVPVQKSLLPDETSEVEAVVPRLMQVRTEIKKKNDILARSLRDQWAEQNVLVVSFVSSPGAGKTEFLQQTLSALNEDMKVAAIVGDLATDNDANRLAQSGAPVRQIQTGNMCHLEANMVEKAMIDLMDDQAFNLEELDILFIENVGNMVCPATYDLGEDLRAVLVSTTEGEDKPLKYPTIFNTGDVAIISKMDLAEVLDFDREQMLASIQSVRPGMLAFEVAAREGMAHEGFKAWIDHLKQVFMQKKEAPTPESWKI